MAGLNDWAICADQQIAMGHVTNTPASYSTVRLVRVAPIFGKNAKPKYSPGSVHEAHFSTAILLLGSVFQAHK